MCISYYYMTGLYYNMLTIVKNHLKNKQFFLYKTRFEDFKNTFVGSNKRNDNLTTIK